MPMSDEQMLAEKLNTRAGMFGQIMQYAAIGHAVYETEMQERRELRELADAKDRKYREEKYGNLYKQKVHNNPMSENKRVKQKLRKKRRGW